MVYETLRFEKRNSIGYVTVSRPEKLNALNHQVIEELHDCLQILQKDEEVRAVILTGAGKKPSWLAQTSMNLPL